MSTEPANVFTAGVGAPQAVWLPSQGVDVIGLGHEQAVYLGLGALSRQMSAGDARAIADALLAAADWVSDVAL